MNKYIPLPDFLPDQSAASGGLNIAQNVYRSIDGYRPIRAVNAITDALPAPFRGGCSLIGGDGTSVLIVGTTTGLSLYAAGGWTNLLTGLSITGNWRFTQFGNYMLAVNGGATTVTTLTGTITTTALVGAPTGRFITVVGDYVVIGQGAGSLLNIYTSAFNDHTGWTPGVNQSTIQPMLTGGEIMGLAGGEYGVILQRQRIMRMNVSGDPLAPFSYAEITPNIGCASKASVIAQGRTVFFLSDRGFMALDDGQAPRAIGSEKVDRSFQASVSKDDYERLFAALDPVNKLVMWCVPGTPGTLWIYNFELDKWSTASLPIEGIFPGFTTSLTLEQVAALYPVLDTIPYSLDDSRFSGGAPQLFVVQGQAIGTLTGATLEATLSSSFTPLLAGYRTRHANMLPLTDATDGITVALDCRERMGDAPNIVTSSEIRASGQMPIRHAGRYSKTGITIAAGTQWGYIQGVAYEIERGGRR